MQKNSFLGKVLAQFAQDFDVRLGYLRPSLSPLL
jgi:hypothetical protein